MKCLLTAALLCLLPAGNAFAHDNLFKAFSRMVSSSYIEAGYSYSAVISGVKTDGEGTVSVQGQAYHFTGNGLEIWCDGSSEWVADSQSKEMFIEPAGDIQVSSIANPASVFINLGTSFSVDSIKKAENGLNEYRLLPVSSNGFKECVVWLSGTCAAPVLEKARVVTSDGISVDIFFNSVTLSSEMKPESFFRPADLGAGWVVTDLR